MSEPTVPQRPAPGGAYRLSAVTISLAGPAAASPAVTSLAIPLLRKARALGVTSFDLSDAPFPALAEQTIARAFPEEDPDLVVIIGWPALPGEDGRARIPVGIATHSVESREVGPAIEESLLRLGGRRRVVVDWNPARTGPGGATVVPGPLERLRSDGRIVDVAVRLRPDAGVRPADVTGLCSGSLSLLDLALVNEVRRAATPSGFALLARDVFAGGALDGTLLGGPFSGRGPAGPPAPLAALHARLDPILRLGFLTRGRSRTLAQAALQFALHWPWVLTAVVPLPSPERLETVLRMPSGPGLNDTELAEIGVVAPPVDPGPRAEPE